MIIKAIKKPIEIQAIQWTGDNFDEVKKFCGSICGKDVAYKFMCYTDGITFDLYIRTLEGDMQAKIGSYIIKGVQGECYPCDKSIFEKTYDIIG